MPYLVLIGRNFGVWSQKLSFYPLWCPQTSSTLDLSTSEQQYYSFLTKGLAPSTCRSYALAQAQFILFCTQLGRLHCLGSPCPVDEWTLCLFGTFLAARIQHSSIKVYFSGIRALHIEQGFPDPLANCLRFQRVVRSIKCSQGSSSSSWLPITDDLMLVIWQLHGSSFPRSPHVLGWLLPWVLWLPSCFRVHCLKSSYNGRQV